jgi:hypothetical protein
MRWIITVLICIWASACGVAPQPESIRTVAAFEVPLPSQVERERFLSVLRHIAEQHAMHVDAATREQLERTATVIPGARMTISAGVWRGTSDDEPIAFIMDGPDHLGQGWIFFARGKDPALSSRFREATMREVMRNWPETLSLPIMPSGAIPLHGDLIRTPNGYVVHPAEAHKYALHDGSEKPR